ncbi:MAG: hypothetical protein HQ488_00060 [Parcubacteria group bacterium]|nr:hypothetical protein [Parcubacteria group bacterium]
MGFEIKTMDIDERIKPDFVCDVSSEGLLKLNANFDLVIAAEVLEHIRYEDSLKVLDNLRSITSKLLITLPHTNNGATFWYMKLKIPMFKIWSFSTKFFSEEKYMNLMDNITGKLEKKDIV